MKENKEGRLPKEQVVWLDSMWPISADVLDCIPDELLPDMEELGSIKYPWELLKLLRKILAERITSVEIDPTAEIHSSAVIEGPVRISKDVKILPHASLIGPLYIGEGVLIGNLSTIRQSIICKESEVGIHMEVGRSVIAGNCKCHSAIVLDSFLSREVQIAGGSATTNFRADEETISIAAGGSIINTGLTKMGAVMGSNSKLNAYAITMPGTLVGKNSIIGPGVHVSGRIEDNVSYYLDQRRIRIRHSVR